MKSFRSFVKDERGSISLLIMSLFMSTLIVLVILTNISSIYLAKRALTQASEAAVQRGVRNLDLQTYYQSDYNFWQFAWNLTGEGETDPGIPIDCQKGRDDALSAMEKWMQLSESKETANGRENLEDIRVNRVECDGYQLTISTSADVRLPFLLPFINLDYVEISTTVASIAQRRITTNYYGIDIG
uniref:TadE/TadG family type IV pilus assembly protein n=2 Tax=Candidatus Planktophila sp. TaxID=2175601 RepID=UPI00404ACE14